MASIQVSPRAISDAIAKLSTVQSKELFFKLDVPLHILDDITDDPSKRPNKIYFAQAWFDSDVEASWEKLVAGLEKIGMNVLANELASQHGIQISSNQNFSSPLPISLSTCPAKSVSQSAALTPIAPPSNPAPSVDLSLTPAILPTSSANRVTQVRTEIDQLSDSFSDLMSDTRADLCTKEERDPSFIDKFRDRLLELPVAQKAPHAKFFLKNEDDLLQAKNMHKIFAILRRYCNYRNYEIIREVVRKFCEALLQQRMREYCESLQSFEKATTIDIYLVAIRAHSELTTEFKKMAMKLNKPSSVCTLYEVRELQETIAERASLEMYSVYIGVVGEGSIFLTLVFHASCMGWILGVLTPEFLHSHLLSDVVLDGHHLSIVDEPQWILVRTYVFTNVEGRGIHWC